jgi:uncharacterized protein
MRYFLALLPMLITLSCQPGGSPQHAYTNALADEASPYLQQHAHNPVNWHPWGKEALQKAQKEDKLLLISIGYAACHWCHVMEHESFEDTTVARIMNENFVAVKVDREERPDVDNIYMTACQLAGEGSCGWPLNAFALPNGQPVWAGTYFPKKQWLEILRYFDELYEDEREKLEEYGALLADGIKAMEAPAPPDHAVERSETILNANISAIHQQADRRRGGMKGAPKFPLPVVQELLLQSFYHNSDSTSLDIVATTLNAMANGGIYDHLGGGFARYSTDADWHVPHFEKMLYDNAQIVSLYSHAYKATGKKQYQRVVEQSLEFIKREMTSPEGGFYSSLDADSEGEEGQFYLWRSTEVDSLIGDEQQAAVFKAYYGIEPQGNWEASNILYRQKNTQEILEKYKLTPDELNRMLQKSRQSLFQARSERPRPGLDDKQLSSWNALMISGYADAYQAFSEPGYKAAALKAGHLLRTELMQQTADGQSKLMRSYKDGKAYIDGFLDDYAFTIRAFLDLYAITFDEEWLEEAKALAEYAIDQFGAEKSPMFYYTSASDDPLIARQIKVEDNVLPSGNSSMAHNLLRLGTYLYDTSYLQRSENMLQAILPELKDNSNPTYYSNWFRLYAHFLYPYYEVAVVGPACGRKRAELQRHYLPNVQLLGTERESNLDLLKGKLKAGATFVYVCQDKICQLPVEESELALRQIKAK